MGMRKIKDACVSTGEYTTQSGETKKRWANVGSMFESDDGRIYVKLEVMPFPKIGKDGSPELWISFFDPKDRQQTPQPSRNQVPGPQPQQARPQPPPAPRQQQPAFAPEYEEEQNIPF
jgi:hypothetical protein